MNLNPLIEDTVPRGGCCSLTVHRLAARIIFSEVNIKSDNICSGLGLRVVLMSVGNTYYVSGPW